MWSMWYPLSLFFFVMLTVFWLCIPSRCTSVFECDWHLRVWLYCIFLSSSINQTKCENKMRKKNKQVRLFDAQDMCLFVFISNKIIFVNTFQQWCHRSLTCWWKWHQQRECDIQMLLEVWMMKSFPGKETKDVKLLLNLFIFYY